MAQLGTNIQGTTNYQAPGTQAPPPVSQGGPNDPNDPAYQNPNPTALGPNQLLPGQRNLDSTTQGLISNQLNQADQSPSYFSGQLMNGVGAQGGLLDTSDQQQHNAAALGMSVPSDLQSALARQSSNSFNNTMTNLQNNANFQAPMMQGTAQNQASQELAQNEQIKNSNYQQQAQYAQNQQNLANQYNLAQSQGRSQALASILGIGGAIAGSFIAPGAGTVAGGAIGSGLGNIVGGAGSGAASSAYAGGVAGAAH